MTDEGTNANHDAIDRSSLAVAQGLAAAVEKLEKMAELLEAESGEERR